MKPLIIYHANCPDGWGAAWWLGRHLDAVEGGHDKHPGVYGEPPPWDLIDGRDVWVVDFSYPAQEMHDVASRAERLTVFDHHETADQELDPGIWGRMTIDDAAASAATTRIVIDQERSGCGLVGWYVNAEFGGLPPLFFAHIEDRDLWRFDLDDTRDVFAAVTSHPYTDDAWDRLHVTPYDDLVNEGRVINRWRDRLIDQVAASSFLLQLTEPCLDESDVAGFLVPTVSSPYAIGSDVAGRLAEAGAPGIGGYVILHADTVQVGLRSRDDGPNVAEIARWYGGGGHRHAAGFRLTWPAFHASLWEFDRQETGDEVE